MRADPAPPPFPATGTTTLATWDVFHSDTLEVRRGLTTAEVRAALGRGELRDDDLIRPAGTTAWTRILDMPPLADPDAGAGVETPPPSADQPGPEADDPDAGERDDDDPGAVEPVERLTATFDDDVEPEPAPGNQAGREPSSVELVTWDDGDPDDPLEEDEAAAEFTLARAGPTTVEELDLAAMVDVAFQLVLFFLVTATTVLFKSLEVPRPNPESPPAEAAAQAPARTLNDLRDTNIVVEIDPAGAVKIDGEPVPAEFPALVERLRVSRERTHRQTMLLSADFATPHRSAVLAYDAANEIGLGIAIARPKSPKTP